MCLESVLTYIKFGTKTVLTTLITCLLYLVFPTILNPSWSFKRPYFYVNYSGPTDVFGFSLNAALELSIGKKSNYIAHVQHVMGTPFYGYHETPETVTQVGTWPFIDSVLDLF